ncbi:MAG: hypothetical protein ACI8PB_003495 [Desulforhopalus sp.]|jgi:hypothetical protein
MKATKCFLVLFFMFWLVLPSMVVGKGYMGGRGTVAAEEPAADTDDGGGGIPDTVEGPNNDMMSDAGKLYGDLYTILRQEGVVGDKKLVPDPDFVDDENSINDYQQFVEKANTEEDPDTIVGGEPVLTVIDPGNQWKVDESGNKVYVNDGRDYGWYAADTDDDGIGDTAAQSPYPAQCVQPVASYERWGDISSVTLLTKNRLPMTISYDPTWKRSECEVGQLYGAVEVDANTGVLTIPVNQWFVEPCLDENGDTIDGAVCTWEDPTNGEVTYPHGVLWTALIGEVHFGRLNLSRAPEAVLQSSFDEAINNINSPDTVAIEIDAAGRLLLTKNVYDELKVYTPADIDADNTLDDSYLGTPVLLGTVKKAIDSPLENVALYVKLMKDGHLVTPGDERMPIDRSKNGGIPLWKMLELTDGPGAKALRPTIDIEKMNSWGLDSMVDVSAGDYYTYYTCLNDAGTKVDCLIWDPYPVQPEHEDGVWVGNPAAVSRALVTVSTSDKCPTTKVIVDEVEVYIPDCEGPFTGIKTYDGSVVPDVTDLTFAASHIAAAGDKTGHMTVDMIVYLNSILGINQVLGYSEYDTATGEPTAAAIDYEKNPVYFNYKSVAEYNRPGIISYRGNVATTGGPTDPNDMSKGGIASTYDGHVNVLVEGSLGVWTDTRTEILKANMDGSPIFDNIGLSSATGFPDGTIQATSNIGGFTQQADDNLGVISFIHTYQIPGLR